MQDFLELKYFGPKIIFWATYHRVQNNKSQECKDDCPTACKSDIPSEAEGLLTSWVPI